MNLRLLITIGLLALLSVQELGAAQFIDHGQYRIHYTTFSSMIIPPEVANSHGIVRADNRIILNLSVRLDDKPVKADVTGQVTNLLNQLFELSFKQVTESEAIYYLGVHTSFEHDVLRFNLEVVLDNGDTVPIRFIRRYD